MQRVRSREALFRQSTSSLTCGGVTIAAEPEIDYTLESCGIIGGGLGDTFPPGTEMAFFLEVRNNTTQDIFGDAVWYFNGTEMARKRGQVAGSGGTETRHIQSDPIVVETEGTFEITASFENVVFE